MDEIIEYDRIKEVNIEEEMKSCYVDYAMSVIIGRALPDVRDGLKPVHRRILYAMSELGMTPDKPTRKSARIVGEVLGKYHPHGDTAVYDAMVRMAQEFSTRYMTIYGQGNFGSIDGDGAAAMRYTEAKMSKIALEMLRDINKDTVDFIPNFDESEMEPEVLPARVPHLLVNGSAGIAVGMATNIPPHNLGEVVDGTTLILTTRTSPSMSLWFISKGRTFQPLVFCLENPVLRKLTAPGADVLRYVQRLRWRPPKKAVNRSLSPRSLTWSISPSWWKKSLNWSRKSVWRALQTSAMKQTLKKVSAL